MDEAKAIQTHSAFGMVCCVKVRILASAPRIWSLLIDARGFPRWNSTVTSIEGLIREGQRLRIRVPGTGRTFTPKVSGVVSHRRMTWAGGFAPLFRACACSHWRRSKTARRISRCRRASPASCYPS